MKSKRILALIISIITVLSTVCAYAAEPQIVTISENNKFSVSYTNENIREGSFYSIYVLKAGETEMTKSNILFMRQVVADGTTIEINNFALKGNAKSGDLYICGAGLGGVKNVAVLIGHSCSDPEIVKVDASLPTCTENGIIEHYKCNGCNTLFSDKYANNVITDTVAPATNHQNSEAFHGENNRCDNLRDMDCTYCPDCGKYFTDAGCTNEIEIIASHLPEKFERKEPTCTKEGNYEYYQCTVCYLKFKEEACTTEFKNNGEKIAPQHKLTEVEATAPDCKNNGILHHWHCDGECGKNFADSAAKTELTSTVNPSTGHTWELQANGREVCMDCGEKKPVEIASGVGSGGGGGGGATTYTVKFETNCAEKVSSIKLNNGQTVSKPAEPKNDGYTFRGWFVDEECTEEYDFSQKVTNSFTLYADWIAVTTEKEPEYEDVTDDDWFYDAVMYVCDNGLMNGIAEGVFAPESNITRAMLVTVLYRMENEPTVSASSFKDVEKGSWYENAVVWASANKITSGISETEFAPDRNISREQIATMLYRYAIYKGYDVSAAEKTNIESYTDAKDISSYATSAFRWAVGESIVSGKSETTLNPADYATRAETAALLMRICNKYN